MHSYGTKVGELLSSKTFKKSADTSHPSFLFDWQSINPNIFFNFFMKWIPSVISNTVWEESCCNIPKDTSMQIHYCEFYIHFKLININTKNLARLLKQLLQTIPLKIAMETRRYFKNQDIIFWKILRLHGMYHNHFHWIKVRGSYTVQPEVNLHPDTPYHHPSVCLPALLMSTIYWLNRQVVYLPSL